MRSLYIVTCLFKLHAEYIMQNAGVDELQAGIKISRRNVNNLRHADNSTLMAESEEELKSLLMRVKEESEKARLKLNIKKTNILASSPITSWQIEGEMVEAVTDFLFLGSRLSRVFSNTTVQKHQFFGTQLSSQSNFHVHT